MNVKEKKTVKVYYQNNDIRRFVINTKTTTLKELLLQAYKFIKNETLDKTKPHVVYLDNEGEWVRCDTQEEFEECLFCIKEKDLKLRLTLPKIKNEGKSVWGSGNKELVKDVLNEEQELKKKEQLKKLEDDKKREILENEKLRKMEEELKKLELEKERLENEEKLKKIKEEELNKLEEKLLKEKEENLKKEKEEKLKKELQEKLLEEKELKEKLLKEKKEKEEKEEKKYAHLNTICDHCFAKNFSGKRYKCLDCGDYDLCGKCFDVNEKKTQDIHDRTHTYKMFKKPEEMCTNDDVSVIQLEEKKKEEKKEIYPVINEVSSDEETYAEQIGLLADMGFNDKAKLIKLLKENNGDVQSVVSACLSEYTI